MTALRASYELPASPDELIAEQYAPDLGPDVAGLITSLINAQREWLHLGRLVAYISGRDGVIDLGDSINILSQPDRIQFGELVASGDTAAFRADVWRPLAAYASRVEGLRARLEAYTLPDTRWARELRAGLPHRRAARALHPRALRRDDGPRRGRRAGGHAPARGGRGAARRGQAGGRRAAMAISTTPTAAA